MITAEQKANLVPGKTFLIFTTDIGTLLRKGYVYTFMQHAGNHWRAKELLELGNHTHFLSFNDVEVFDFESSQHYEKFEFATPERIREWMKIKHDNKDF